MNIQIGIFHEYISVLFCFWVFLCLLMKKERILIVIQLSIPMSLLGRPTIVRILTLGIVAIYWDFPFVEQWWY